MLKVRIIPTLLWKDFGLVKGNSFNSWRRVGSVMPAIKVYKSRDVDELMLFDIIASQDNSEPDHESIEDFSEECSVPLSVGGGVCNLRQILSLLHAGADKVSINTAAYNDINLIGRSAQRFGVQCIVSSIDVRKNND